MYLQLLILIQTRNINEMATLKQSQLVFYAETPKKTHLVVFLKNKIQTYAQASFSVILSSAAYILYHFPKLIHPNNPQLKQIHQRFDEQFPSPYMSLHPFFDEWVQILTHCFFDGNAVRSQDTLYLKVKVSYQFIEAIIKNEAPYQEFQSIPSVCQLFNLPAVNPTKKIGWISCSTSQKNTNRLEPTVNTPSILLGQIYNNEEYKIWNILLKQIPTVQQLMTYDTLIIPGSGLSVISQVKEVDLVAKNITQAYQKSTKLKILGICYGHQLMAREFGAKIVKRDRYGGLETIEFDSQILSKFAFLQPLSKYKPPRICLSEHHQDFVTTTPQQYYRLATSNSCQNQALVSKNGRILSTQFHPEYNYSWAKCYTTRMTIYYKNKQIQKPKYSHSSEQLQQHYEACQDFRKCIMKFI